MGFKTGKDTQPEAVAPALRLDDPWDAPVSPTSHAAAPFAYPGAPDLSALVPWMDDIRSIGTTGGTHDETAPSTIHRTAPETRVADSGPPIPRGAKYDPRWVGLAQGSIREAAAPRTVRLPDEVDKDLGESWKQTVKDGNEHGGNIVRTYGGKYDVRHNGSGDPNTFYGDDHDVGFGQDYVGNIHTHPGAKPETFSDDDIANMADHGRSVSVMRAAENQTYMLARTKEFDAMVADVEKEKDGEKLMEDRAAFRSQMKGTYEAAYQRALKNDPKDHAAAVEAGTQAAASKYHLLYYSGKGANLSRVGGPPPAKK